MNSLTARLDRSDQSNWLCEHRQYHYSFVNKYYDCKACYYKKQTNTGLVGSFKIFSVHI